MNWPTVVAAQSATYRNCKGKLLRGRVQEMGSGCADARVDGTGWKLSCSKSDAHRISSGGQWGNLDEEDEEFSTWNNCHSLRLHSAAGCSEEQIHGGRDETGADWGSSADAHTNTHTHTLTHRHVHIGKLIRELRHAHTKAQSLPECVLLWPSGPFWCGCMPL